jgi:hypothetical protein
MNSELSYQTSFCNKYDALLHECESAQRIWSEWRDEMNSIGPYRANKEVSDELLRLQAKFAKAYARLEKHNHECALCQFVARMSEERGELACVPASPEHTWPV